MVRVLLEAPAGRALTRRRVSVLECLRWGFLLIGLVMLGFTGYIYLDSHIYQAYEDWAFNQQSNGKTPAILAFLRDKVWGGQDAPVETGAGTRAQTRGRSSGEPYTNGSLIGRLEIPRLGVHAIVREGVDDRTLRRAVGHVPGTAKPGGDGNVGLAGHRDTFFRELRDVHRDDRIVVETLDTRYEYTVDSMKVVSPKDVSVLEPTKAPSLTLVTCYPFYFVGNAPRRFIVRARQVSVEARDGSAFRAGRSGS
jgi:sortase A